MNIEGNATIGGDLNVTFGSSADEIAAKVVAAMRGEVASAAQANMERETIFRLARGIRPEVIGFDQAVKELENAVGIALDVIAKGERGSNQEAFVEDVLKRLAETTMKGDFDGGAKCPCRARPAGRGAAPSLPEIAGNLARSGRRTGFASAQSDCCRAADRGHRGIGYNGRKSDLVAKIHSAARRIFCGGAGQGDQSPA